MTLDRLIDEHSLDRPRAALAREVEKVPNTVKNWALGVTPTPRWAVPKIATWLGVDEATVRSAADESRRVYLDSLAVGGIRQPAATGEGPVGEGHLTVNERQMVGEAAALLAQAASILAKIAEREREDEA